MKAKSSCCQPISPRRLRGERRVGLALVSRRIAGRIIGFLRFARKKPRVWNLCGLGTERVSPRTSPILAKLGSRRRSPRPAEILGDAARGLGGRAAEALAGEYACGCRQPGPVALLLGRVHVPIQRAPLQGPWEALRASPAALSAAPLQSATESSFVLKNQAFEIAVSQTNPIHARIIHDRRRSAGVHHQFL